jgi:MFS transporter, UMF1 family
VAHRRQIPDTLRRQRFGWYMYDWANSAFAVTILAALFGPYLDRVVVPAGGWAPPIPGMGALSSTSLYGYTLGLSAFFVLLSSPVLGAIADSGHAKKRFLMFFCGCGSASTAMFFFVGPGDVGLALALFFVSNFCFVSANVFYDAFLPHLATPEEQDEVSGTGYAYGYAGGGLLFILHLLLVQFHTQLGIADAGLAIRIALSSVGLWWGGFALISFRRLVEIRGDVPVRSPLAVARDGFRRVLRTSQLAGSLRQLLLFLLAFMIYNDGIQTVIAMATIYGSEELRFDTLTLMGCLLMVQIVGIAGSRLFARIARRIGTKRAVLLSLVIWTGVVVFGYVMTQPYEFWLLGGIVGLVLGGSQALSRSMYSKIIPAVASAEFFGFFSVFEKFSAIWGPLVFAVLRQTTGSSRLSILALVVFFAIGGTLLSFVNLERAQRDSEQLGKTLSL